MNITIIDQLVVFVTSIFLFIHIKQLMATPNFLFSGIIGIWIALTIFDMYALYRKKQQ